MIDRLLDPDPEDTRACREDALDAIRRAIAYVEGSNWSELDDEIYNDVIGALEEAETSMRMTIHIMEDTDVD